MNLSTKYLGLDLKNPIIAGASPMTSSLDAIKSLEDNGISAVVMHSIFEEQITHEGEALDYFLTQGSESFSESQDFFPQISSYENAESEQYLEEITKIKASTDIPIIVSLNGSTNSGWVKYAKEIEQTGADAIELNIAHVSVDVNMSANDVEELYIKDIRTVKESTSLPISVKMSPNFSSPANMAKKLEIAGANGLVLFDRPTFVDIDLNELSTTQKVNLSSSNDLSESLRWSAILFNQLNLSLCASTGVHSHFDILKAIMSGADCVQMVSSLLINKEIHVKNVLVNLKEWMQEKEYSSLDLMKGSISLLHTDNPSAYERASYMQALQTYRGN